MARACEAWHLIPSRGLNYDWRPLSDFEIRTARGYQLQMLEPRDAEYWFLHRDAELRKEIEWLGKFSP